MKRMTMLAVAVAAALSAGAGAQPLDGKQPVLCAATTVFVCEPEPGCVTGAPDAVNLPTFWRVDPGAKTVESRRADGSERTSAIDLMAVEGGRFVAQGSDEGFGWSLSVDAETGKMLLSGGSELGYLVFGECTTP